MISRKEYDELDRDKSKDYMTGSYALVMIVEKLKYVIKPKDFFNFMQSLFAYVIHDEDEYVTENDEKHISVYEFFSLLKYVFAQKNTTPKSFYNLVREKIHFVQYDERMNSRIKINISVENSMDFFKLKDFLRKNEVLIEKYDIDYLNVDVSISVSLIEELKKFRFKDDVTFKGPYFMYQNFACVHIY